MNSEHNFKVGDVVFITRESVHYTGIYAGCDAEIINIWSGIIDVKAPDGKEFTIPSSYIVHYNPRRNEGCTCGAWAVHGKKCAPIFHYHYCVESERL